MVDAAKLRALRTLIDFIAEKDWQEPFFLAQNQELVDVTASYLHEIGHIKVLVSSKNLQERLGTKKFESLDLEGAKRLLLPLAAVA